MYRFVLIMVWLFVCSSPALAAKEVESQARPVDLIVSTTPTIEGYKIKEYLGIVRGVTVRQPTIGQGLSASLERLKGGHISAYVAMCETARQQAYDLCLEQARALKADALIGVSYDSCGFDAKDNVATEVVCYGTAVTVERNVANRPDRETIGIAEAATQPKIERSDSNARAESKDQGGRVSIATKAKAAEGKPPATQNSR